MQSRFLETVRTDLGTFFHLGTPVSVFDLYNQYLTFLLPFYCGLTLGKLCHAFMNLSLAPFWRFHRLILSITTILHQICRVVHIHECFVSHVIFSAGFFIFCAPTFFKIGHLKPKNDLNSEAFLNVWFSFIGFFIEIFFFDDHDAKMNCLCPVNFRCRCLRFFFRVIHGRKLRV